MVHSVITVTAQLSA